MARQNLLFSYFACTLTSEIRAAKAEGRYFEGVSDLSGSNITDMLEPKASNLHCFSILSVLATVHTPLHPAAKPADAMRFQMKVLHQIQVKVLHQIQVKGLHQIQSFYDHHAMCHIT